MLGATRRMVNVNHLALTGEATFNPLANSRKIGEFEMYQV